MSGWTQSEAESRAALIPKIISRSVKSATASFDLDWNEWVVVIECAGAPTLIERKRRHGLREQWKEGK